MHQISNLIYADDSLLEMDIPTKHLPNPYVDTPYILIKNFFTVQECRDIVRSVLTSKEAVNAQLRGAAIDESIRKTDIYTLSSHQKSLYECRFDTYRDEIERFFPSHSPTRLMFKFWGTRSETFISDTVMILVSCAIKAAKLSASNVLPLHGNSQRYCSLLPIPMTL